MSAIPCPKKVTCPGTDSPVGNYSSEAADPFLYLGVGFRGWEWSPENPGTIDPGDTGDQYFSEVCGSVCTSTVSQAVADACAQQAATNCYNNNGTSEATTYSNTAQSAARACGEGTFTYTVAAGTLTGYATQAAADAAALALAQQQVQAVTPLCFASEAPANCCVGVAYEHILTITGGSAANAWALATGSLPPGLTLQAISATSYRISGTPTTAGLYNFTVRVTDAGNYAEQPATVTALGFDSPTGLPDGDEGVAYSYTVLPTLPGTYTWAVTSGSLPPGLTLDASTGAITGTPTLAGDYNFEITQTQA